MYGCIYQTEDERCMKFSNGKSQSWCVGKDEPCGYRKPSNADRIRAMSDEELADWISSQIDCEVCRSDYGGGERPCDNRCCLDFWLDWLREEVAENE